MKTYQKLVRDNIPALIEKEGRKVHYRLLSEKEFRQELDRKLSEEIAEYETSREIEELADIEEIIRALVRAKAASFANLRSFESKKPRKMGLLRRGFFLKQPMIEAFSAYDPRIHRRLAARH